MNVRVMALVVGGASLAGGLVVAQAPQPGAAPSLRIEGSWVRTDTQGAGNYGGLAAHFPQAVLTPEAQAAGGRAGGRGGGGGRGGAPQPATGRGPLPPGQAVVVNTMPCGGRAGGAGYGGQLITPDSVGIHFVESRDEVIFAGERAGVRHIYIDGRKHPDPSRWTPTSAGHSIGRYEGSELVAETVGFSPGAVPGGGQRTPETVLTERFAVAPDGKSMTVTYTWTDPKIYQKPHTYQLVFGRAPAVNGIVWAFEEWCDASDPAETQSITPPKQLE